MRVLALGSILSPRVDLEKTATLTSLLSTYDAEFPGFVDYFQRMLTEYFMVGPRTHPVVAARMEEGLRGMAPEVVRGALAQFAQAGIFETLTLHSDDQVQVIWGSPLLALCRSAIGGAPTSTDHLVASFPSPVSGITEHAERQMAFRGSDFANLKDDGSETFYWKESLQLAAPELYLWPFLRKHGKLHGLDLGCGWGRGALGMRDYSRLWMTGVDIGEDELELLRRQAEQAGLGQRVRALVADITQLPFACDSFDFALSYLVLDLLSEGALQLALAQILRCLKADSPFYVDMPTDYFCGSMQLQQKTPNEFIDLLHRQRAHGKVLQLAFHVRRVARQYTFAVLSDDAQSGARPSWLVKAAAARLQGQPLPAAPTRADLWQRIAKVRNRSRRPETC